jgi:two-component system, OmpR family, alkaline phosphatase synthesis response regulator PhoP
MLGRAASQDRSADPAGAAATESGEGNRVSQRVLVVEDEPSIVESLSFLMKQAGFDVLIAGDGTTALRIVESELPDLVVLDVMLPRRDGYDVCQAIRANRKFDKVRIMMLSAKGRELDRRKGMELGADDYVTKPFSTRDLVERARALLGLSPE